MIYQLSTFSFSLSNFSRRPCCCCLPTERLSSDDNSLSIIFSHCIITTNHFMERGWKRYPGPPFTLQFSLFSFFLNRSQVDILLFGVSGQRREDFLFNSPRCWLAGWLV